MASRLRLTLLPLGVIATLLAAPAWANTGDVPRAARLLDVGDAVGASAPTGAQVEAAPAVATGPSFGLHWAKTLGVGVFGSTAGVLIGYGLGTLSNSLIWAALPVLLSNLLIGPAVTALVAMVVGNVDAPGRYGFWGAFGVAAVLNAVAYVVTSFLPFAVAWSNPVSLLLYSLIDGVLMTTGSVGFMHLTAKREAPATIASFVPGVTDTQFIALSKVGF